MSPPASANPEMSYFSFNEDRPFGTHGSGSRPSLMHHPAESTARESQSYDLAAPRAQDHRISVSSLIDLDESLPDPTPDLTRPSTANSDVVSVSGSDVGMANPFDLERHASLYQPVASGNREPSIYVSDDSDFARLMKAPSPLEGPAEPPGEERSGRRAIESYLSDTGLYSGGEYVEPEYLAINNRQGRTQQPANSMPQSYSESALMSLPLQPEPPSSRVMQGMGSRQETRDELQRLLDSFHEHLSFVNAHVSSLPIRRPGASRQEQAVDD